jgi:hypothetical protein
VITGPEDRDQESGISNGRCVLVLESGLLWVGHGSAIMTNLHLKLLRVCVPAGSWFLGWRFGAGLGLSDP